MFILVNVMRKLYASGISSGMRSLQHGGFKVWLGDEAKGIRAEKEFAFDALDSAAAAWLDEEARKHFPDSEYARAS